MSTVSEQVDQKTYCYLHPTVETGLRCNKCGNYICSRCAVRTPVGYRCPQCVKQQQDIFFTALPTDYVIAGAVAFFLGIPAGYILGRLGLLFGFLLGVGAGGIIAEVIHRALQRRRGRYTYIVVAMAVVLGGLVTNFELFRLLLTSGATEVLPTILFAGIPIVICAAAAAARFRFGK